MDEVGIWCAWCLRAGAALGALGDGWLSWLAPGIALLGGFCRVLAVGAPGELISRLGGFGD